MTTSLDLTAPEARPVPEADLVERARGGDRDAFAALVERYWDRLYRWLYQLGRDSHLAEDLTQEAFLKAYARLEQFRPGSNFAAWLFRIGHNAYANACRSRWWVEALPDGLAGPAEDPADEAASNEALRGLAEALGRVPPPFRAALLLRAEEGLSFREIADVLGLTEETARWRVFKARKQLLELLGPRPQPEAS